MILFAVAFLDGRHVHGGTSLVDQARAVLKLYVRPVTPDTEEKIQWNSVLTNEVVNEHSVITNIFVSEIDHFDAQINRQIQL